MDAPNSSLNENKDDYKWKNAKGNGRTVSCPMRSGALFRVSHIDHPIADLQLGT